ncbi:MAG: CBS domain-containing protein [Methanobacteriota archaeon]
MELKKIKAKDVMIKELITIGSGEKIALADLIMARSGIGSLPVVDKGKLVGIITQRDIMLARNYEIGVLMTKDLMSKNLITVGPEASLKEILGLMLGKKIERIPVVENGKLAGLIVHNRVLKAIYESIA